MTKKHIPQEQKQILLLKKWNIFTLDVKKTPLKQMHQLR